MRPPYHLVPRETSEDTAAALRALVRDAINGKLIGLSLCGHVWVALISWTLPAKPAAAPHSPSAWSPC